MVSPFPDLPPLDRLELDDQWWRYPSHQAATAIIPRLPDHGSAY